MNCLISIAEKYIFFRNIEIGLGKNMYCKLTDMKICVTLGKIFETHAVFIHMYILSECETSYLRRHFSSYSPKYIDLFDFLTLFSASGLQNKQPFILPSQMIEILAINNKYYLVTWSLDRTLLLLINYTHALFIFRHPGSSA